MNNAGITAQYGFLFQRKAFVLFTLENAGTKETFSFEGNDDIEISTDESIYSVKTADSNYIQVKSGIVSESCFWISFLTMKMLNKYTKKKSNWRLQKKSLLKSQKTIKSLLAACSK